MRRETSSSPRQGARNQTTAAEGCAKRDARNRAASRRRFDGAELSIPLREQKAQNGMGLYSTKSFCICMESVWLRLGSGPRRWSGRSVWVFLARGRFAAKTPARECWISLDFLVRIETFQWVTRLLAGRIFPRAFSARAGTGACDRGDAKAQDCSWGKLNSISDFLQEIVVRAVPFRPPRFNIDSLSEPNERRRQRNTSALTNNTAESCRCAASCGRRDRTSLRRHSTSPIPPADRSPQ
jgi:hypothetical protein